MNRILTSILASTALVVGLAACGGSPTEAPKVSSSSEVAVAAPAAPSAPVAEESVTEEPAEVTDEPSTESKIQTSFKVGDTAKVGDWEVTVTKVTKPTDKQVKAWNQFNGAAKGQYVLAAYSAKYVGSERTADVRFDLTWKFGGSDSQVYDVAFVVTSSDKADAPTEARPGGTLKLDVAFDVPDAAIKGGVITVEGYDAGFNSTYADFAF
jgi:hypothetical protein